MLRAVIMDGKSAKKLIDKLGIILSGWSLRKEEDIENIGPIGEPESTRKTIPPIRGLTSSPH